MMIKKAPHPQADLSAAANPRGNRPVSPQQRACAALRLGLCRYQYDQLYYYKYQYPYTYQYHYEAYQIYQYEAYKPTMNV